MRSRKYAAAPSTTKPPTPPPIAPPRIAPRFDFFLGAAAVVAVVLPTGAWEGASAAAQGMLCRQAGRGAR